MKKINELKAESVKIKPRKDIPLSNQIDDLTTALNILDNLSKLTNRTKNGKVSRNNN